MAISATKISGIVSRTVDASAFKLGDPSTFPFPRRGDKTAPILVVCEPPSIEAMRSGTPMTLDEHEWFANHARKLGFVAADFQFVALCPPMSASDKGTVSKEWAFVSQYQAGLRKLIEKIKPTCIVTCGALSARMLMNRPVKITKARGIVTKDSVGNTLFPMLSPSLCIRMPDYDPIFEADLSTLSRLQKGDFNTTSLQVTDVDYSWVTDLQFLIDSKPKMLAIDTEGSGLKFRAADFEVYALQISTGPGKAYVVPVSWAYYLRWEKEFNEHGVYLTPDQFYILRKQAKTLLEDGSIQKMGHNMKFDDGCISYGLDANTQSWEHDTELMMRAVCENFMTYSLADATRIYVPEMAGYSDFFDQMTDKGDMFNVCPYSTFHEDGEIHIPGMLSYAGGDVDATFRLARALYPILARERGQMLLYQKVQMRGLISFSKRIENFGQCIDRAALDAYRQEVSGWISTEERELLRLLPDGIKRKYITTPDLATFSRDRFVADVLFSQDGFKLIPKVWTKSTKNLPMPERIPSTSTKDHLPYFSDRKDAAGEFVRRLINFQKAKKLETTYIGKEGENGTAPSGFYQYIQPANDNLGEEKIYPSYNFRTNTSRTNSQDPNGQNFPKRGEFAKGFLRLIKASAGKVLIAADMSQVELRLVAWSAMDREMLRIYNSGGDIHEATAATVMRMSIEAFRALSSAQKKLERFRAKAVNFGFIYGAMAKTFQTYAKTTYGLDYTLSEAEEIRDLFFQKYNLLPWHKDVEMRVRRDGFIRTLHGGVRHLPSIRSPDWGISNGAVRQAINAPIQRMGSDLGVIAIARLAAQADPRLIRPVGFVHDQIICEVDPRYVEQCMGWLSWVMENPPLEEWFGIRAPLPFVADSEFGYNLAETTEVKKTAGGVFVNEQTGIILPNMQVEKPEWWNSNEDEAYKLFMENSVPEWSGILTAPARQRARVVI